MIPIHINQETKFKTVSIVVKFKAVISAADLTERAIVAKLMTKVSRDYPTEQALYHQLAEMYGAHLYSYVSKQKNYHVVTIGIDIVNEKYLAEPGLMNQAIELLAKIILEPLADDFAFDEQKVKLEKELLQAKFDAVRDNKSQYGFQQLIRTMFKSSDYQYPSYGIESKLDHVNGRTVKQAYDAMLNEDEKHIFVIGDIDGASVKQQLTKQLALETKQVAAASIVLPEQSEPVIVNEQVETTQARINIGMYAPIEFGSQDYFAFILLNQIYGGDVTSLLFMNVREKLSLAYQVHSQLDARLGVMYVMAGVNAETKELALSTILDQLNDIKAGKFEDQLLETAKTMLISHKIETFDRPKGWIETRYAQTFDAKEVSMDEWMTHIKSVTKADVANIAKRINIQTIYCLLNEVSE